MPKPGRSVIAKLGWFALIIVAFPLARDLLTGHYWGALAMAAYALGLWLVLTMAYLCLRRVLASTRRARAMRRKEAAIRPGT